ncbi:MND1-interacting protein 1 [Hibiscus syriacus]|uniref:MND1-interacting protein 1 n=1 Tax=Hibiscus syriacus TaxID=106335 RepID=A0A6A2WN44_HIBSY|nr:MND1-interacting protein 1-like [Hibiscus syriacus]XP_039046886.1 MND1-interacting protein 1-like [Hibiscus syriacus]KAE8661872.1 MND1-interacting protein 1 [Hibiscus syriacus]
MGCTRDKHIRSARRTQSVKHEIDHCCLLDKASISKSILESGIKPLNYHLGVNDSAQSPNHNPNNSTDANDHGLGYCTEEELEEILLKNLGFLYNEAISKLISLGYDEDVALKAILRNGHCYGGMDVLTNILHNSLAYLNSSCDSSNGGNSEESESGFPDLRQLEEYSLAGMICLLQQVRPPLSKGDAMWCLLMSDLHVGKASTMEIPSLPSPTNACSPMSNDLESVDNNGVGVMSPAMYRFHGGWGFGNGGEFAVNGLFSCNAGMTLQRDIECPKRINLSPSMKSLLKKNVAIFAASFRANSKQMQTQNQAFAGTMSRGDAPLAVAGGEVSAEKSEESQTLISQDGVNSVLSKFRDLNIDENLEYVGEDQKSEMIISLLHQIKDLEKQVKERKDWAHQKAMQAARKLSSDLTELKMLRMEREEMQQMKKGKNTIDDSTMKRLSEMENALRKASGQVDRANAAVRRLETENAEIRAEMEASKLSASESVTTFLEVAKREKKCLKKLLTWEKQKAKLQELIADEKEKIKDLQQCLARAEKDQKETESKWREELKAKELALAQVEQEQCSKEATEASNKRKLEALRLKIEIDFQRHKDDHQRLEQELSRLKLSAQSTELNHQSDNLFTGKSEGAKPQGETITKLLHELDTLEDSSENEVNGDRECIICSKDEVSIVFLPCTHQVLCAKCNENFGKKGKATCPCCRVPIEQRIRVYGASS